MTERPTGSGPEQPRTEALDQPGPSGPVRGATAAEPGPGAGAGARTGAPGATWAADAGSGASGRPGGRPGAGSAHPGTDSFFDSLRRIDVRRSDDGWIGGVCAGVAHRLGLDPIVIRVALVVLGFVFGVGLLLYLVAWLLIPDSAERTYLERGLRDGEGSAILLLVVTGVVTATSLPWWGGGWGAGWTGWWFASLVLVALALWGLWSAWERREGPGRVGRQHAGPAGYTTAASPRPGGGPGSTTSGGNAPPAGAYSPAGYGAGMPPQAPVVAPVAGRARRPSGGVVAGLLAAGLVLTTYGSLYWAGREWGWPGNHQSVALAGGLAVVGLVLLVLGMTGRRSGFPGFLAALALVATAVAAPLPAGFEVGGRAGQEQWRPVAAAELPDYQLGAGEARLDLTGLNPAELDGQTLDAGVGMGVLRVTVPEDLTVRVLASAGIGEISISGAPGDFGDRRSTGGLNISDDTTLGEGEVDLTLEAHVGIGQITVERD